VLKSTGSSLSWPGDKAYTMSTEVPDRLLFLLSLAQRKHKGIAIVDSFNKAILELNMVVY